MESIERRILYSSRSDEFRLYPLGDIHAGIKHCAERDIKKMVETIKDDPFALWVGMGDYAECITMHDPRWDIDVVADWVEKSNIGESERQWLVKLFKPIADKCLGLLSGNHEESIRLHNCQDIHLDLCRDLNVPNLGWSCFVTLKFTRQHRAGTAFVCHFEHGAGAAQTDGGRINRLKMALIGFEGDIYGMGHLHDIKTDRLPYLYVGDNLRIRERKKVAAITGSWFRAYQEGVRASYAEKKGYRPTPVGCPVFIMRPDKAEVDVKG